MDKDKFDKTKHNIRVEELDERTRKKMFNKFVDAGGEVLSERQKRRHLLIDKEKQKKYQKQLDKHHQDLRQNKAQDSPKNRQAGKKNLKPVKTESRSAIGQFFIRFKIRLRLKFLRITQFNGFYFNVKFLERFNNLYKPALMEIQVIYLHLFRKDLKIGNQLIVQLDKLTPLYYELIEKVGVIYDKMIIDQVVEHYLNFPDVPKKIAELRPVLMDLYRKLVVLYPYRATVIESFSKAIDFHQRISSERGFAAVSMKRKLRNSANVLFNKLFPRLHLLFCLFQGERYVENDPVVGDILNISAEDRPGNRKGFSENEEPEEIEGPAEGEEKTVRMEDDSVTDNVKQGLSLMYNLNIPELRKKYDDSGMFSYVSENDKILLTYILFNEFDKEYSFLLTTKKIKYNSDRADAGLIDYRHVLLDMYDDMRKCHEALKNYANELRYYEKVRHERPVGSTQYIEYTNRLGIIEKRKNAAGRTARQVVKTHVDKLIDVFDRIVSTLNSDSPLISNPQDELEFDPMIEGPVKLNNKKIYQAMITVYNYLCAFSYRLSDLGDLSGALIKNSEENGDDRNGKTANNNRRSPQKPRQKKSILDELDDML